MNTSLDLDRLLVAIFSLAAAVALQVAFQLVREFRGNGGRGSVREARELVETILEKMLERSAEATAHAYDPEEWKAANRRVAEIHDVVVTGYRRGALPQRRDLEERDEQRHPRGPRGRES